MLLYTKVLFWGEWSVMTGYISQMRYVSKFYELISPCDRLILVLRQARVNAVYNSGKLGSYESLEKKWNQTLFALFFFRKKQVSSATKPINASTPVTSNPICQFSESGREMYVHVT